MKTRSSSISILAALTVATLALAGCSSKSPDAGSSADTSGKQFKVGISQIVQHPSLDMIAEGFKDAVKDAGLNVTYDEQNAQGDPSNAATIAGSFAADSSIDLILAIATPTAQAVVQAIQDRPILFAGITDPVAAQLVPGEGPSGTNVSGTSDLNPNAKPVHLIQELVPGVKKIGVLYTSSETNSEVQVAAYKAEAEPLGITIETQAISNTSEVISGVEALAGVDALLIPTDNGVISALEGVVGFANQNKVPLFTADAESVVRGSVAARGISYYQLGRRTGEMAVRVLAGGEKIGDIPFLVVEDTELKYNPDAAKQQGVELPEEVLADGVDVTKS